MRTPRFGEKPMTREVAAAFRAVKREDFFPPGAVDLARVSALMHANAHTHPNSPV